MQNPQHPGTFKIGDLAKRTGISVRTLHHYDEIGLLRPSSRSAAGYRIYGKAELLRLQHILSLRNLGLSLPEIKKTLDGSGDSLVDTLERHIASLDTEVTRLTTLREKLARLHAKLQANKACSSQSIIESIEESAMFEKYYTPDQLAYLERRKEIVGEERMKQVPGEWQEIFEQFAKLSKEGASPQSDESLALARKARMLIDEFTGGNPGIENSLKNLYRGEGSDSVLGRHGMEVEPNGMSLMNQALTTLDDGEGP